MRIDIIARGTPRAHVAQSFALEGSCRLPRLLRSVVRSIKLSAIFLYGGVELAMTRPHTRSERAEWLHRFCVRAVRSMGIVLKFEGTFPDRGAVISNHMGYLDIMAFAALHRVVFVSKAEMQQLPLLGWMTTMSGTVYVERGRGGSAERARAGIRAAAEESIPVVFFPEGTTTNGGTILKFHSGILAQVLSAEEPVTAAFISYRLTEDNGPDISVADDVCFWGDVELFPHIFRMLGLRGIEVSVRVADAPIQFTDSVSQRKRAAGEARAAVLALGGIVEPAPAPRVVS